MARSRPIAQGRARDRGVDRRGTRSTEDEWAAFPVPHIVTQTPEPQRCPVSHWASEVQVQKPSLHAPVAPHWLSMTQVPWTHA
jgi:hypothetical protein